MSYIGNTIRYNNKPPGAATGYSYSTQYQAVINYAISNGITLPPEAVRIVDDQRVRASVTSGEWAGWDIFYFTKDRGSYKEYAKINWKNPGTFNLVEVGTLTFDDLGFTGNGTNSYLRTGWIASTHAVNYTQNSASVYAYTSVSASSSARSLYGCRSTSNTLRLELIPTNSGAHNYTINSTTSTTVSNVITWTQGGWFMNRTSSSAIRSGWDNFQVGSASVTSTGLPVTELYILACNNNGTAIQFNPGTIGVFAVGGSQSGRESEINNRWNETFYDQSLGFTPTNKYVYSIHGQSNAEGIVPITTLSTTLRRQFANTFIWWNPQENASWGRWCKLKAGRNNQQGQTRLQWYGNEIAFANLFETNHPGDVLYIIKLGVGNSAVSNTVNPNWDPTTPIGTNGLYLRAKNYFQVPARAALPVGTTDFGIVWMQGEEDANNATTSAQTTFRNNTLALFNAFRTDLSLPSLPITVCRINANISRDPGYLADVRAVQGTASGQLCDTATYPNNTFFSTDAYPLIDTVHFEQLPYGTDLYDLFL